MENATYASRLRYLDADDVNDAVVDYDGLTVVGPDGETLGTVDGFIVDAEAKRVHHIVVDAGGWFASRRLLLPIGHASLAADRRALRTDITRDTLRRFPEYDEERFREFTDEELRAFERHTVVACCPDESLEDVSATSWGYTSWRHYREPGWFAGARYEPARLRSVGRETYGTPVSSGIAEPAARRVESREVPDRELVRAQDEARDAGARSAGDVSPHFEGRAQPGDVLGIETGGERTGVGETAEEENKRRQTAERTVRRDDEPRQSER